MLQRIQTIYLAVAFMVISVTYFFKIAIFNTASDPIILSILGFFNQEGTVINHLYPLVVLTGLIASLILFQLFNYKRRIRQIQTGKAIIILSILWYLVTAIYIYNYFKTFEAFLSAQPGVTLFLPIVTIILIIFANKHIQKDEELVRSVDRIR